MKALLALLLSTIVGASAVIQHTGHGFYTTIIETGSTYYFQYTYDVGRQFTFPNGMYVSDHQVVENKVMFETFNSNYPPVWDRVALDGVPQYTWCPIPEPTILVLLAAGALLVCGNRPK